MSDIDDLRAELASVKKQIEALASGGLRASKMAAAQLVVTQATHSFTVVGTPIRCTSSGWVKSKADTDANAIVDAVVGGVISANCFIAVFPGHIITGLSGLTKGNRYYLDATTAGAVTTTAPTIKVPVYDAISTTAVVHVGAGGGGAAPTLPTEDGTVWCSKSNLSGGEWVLTVDIGRNATGKAGKLQLLSPNAAGVAVEIDAALVTAAGKKLTVREIDICDAGTDKKMMILASATY